jgi:membrane protein
MGDRGAIGATADAAGTDQPGRSWRATVKSTVSKFQDDRITDAAAALTYYGVLALFPALIVLVALLGLLGEYPRTVNATFRILSDAGVSNQVLSTIRRPLEQAVRNKGGAGALLGVGLLLSLWSASGYLGAFMRTANDVYEVDESRPFWKLRPLQVAITLLMVVLVTILLVGIVLSGPLASSVAGHVGLGHTAATVWSYMRWPAMALAGVLLIAVLYHAAPNLGRRRFRWLSPGGAVAVALWGVVTVGFFIYVSHLGSYNQTYGSLGTIVVLLVWMWLSNIALLFGLELDARLHAERGEPTAGDEAGGR